MPLLLLLPLLLAAVFALWVVLLPLSLWQRYRLGRARRRAQGWVVRGNAWLLAASVPPWLAGAWLATRWLPGALQEAAFGLGVGVVVGIASLWLTRFEHDERGLSYTPQRWLVLAMTLLLAVRVLVAVAAAWRHWGTAGDAAAWQPMTGLLLVGGVLLGYQLAYTWGLRARLPIARTRRGA